MGGFCPEAISLSLENPIKREIASSGRAPSSQHLAPHASVGVTEVINLQALNFEGCQQKRFPAE